MAAVEGEAALWHDRQRSEQDRGSEYDLCTPSQEFGRFYSFRWPRSIEIIRDTQSGVDTNPTLSANHTSIVTAFSRTWMNAI